MSRKRIAWRREALLLCLVAMDALCLTPWANLLAGSADHPQRRVPGAVLLVLLLTTVAVARALEASRLGLGAQRALCGGLAVITGVVLAALFLYGEYPFFELDWLPAWAAGLPRAEGAASVALMGVALYAWWRGIALAQSRLASDNVSRGFRAGVAAWLAYHICGLFTGAGQPTVWLLLYFALGLTAVGLARVEEAQRERGAIRSPFAGAWVATLAGLAVAVVALGTAAALALSWASGPLYRRLLVPLGTVLSRLLAAIVTGLGYLLGPALEWLVSWLRGMLSPLAGRIPAVPTPAPAPTPGAPIAAAPPSVALQVVLWALAALGLLGLAALAAGRLQRRRPPEPEIGLEATWEAAPAEPAAGIGATLGRLRERIGAALSALRPLGSSPATIHEIYAGLQRLAAWRGVARDDAQTPYEYERRLDEAWPQTRSEVESITDAYVRAHYGRREISPEALQALRAAWQRLLEAWGPPGDQGSGQV